MNNLTLYELLPTILECVQNGQEAVFTPGGISMQPMIYGGKDRVALVKPRFPLKKSDILLYRREDGILVLHRLVGFQNGQYVFRGDNTLANEYGITDENILAMVSRFCRNGKWHSVDEKGYRFYAAFWSAVYPFRRVYAAVKSRIYALWVKIKRLFAK